MSSRPPSQKRRLGGKLAVWEACGHGDTRYLRVGHIDSQDKVNKYRPGAQKGIRPHSSPRNCWILQGH